MHVSAASRPEVPRKPHRTRPGDRPVQYIGLLISDIQNPFFAEVARAVEDAADTAGVQVFLCNSDMDAVKQVRYFEALRTRQLDGIIMNSIANMTEGQQAELARAGIPVVLLNCLGDADPRFSTVSADNSQAGYVAGQYLMRSGHREVGHITGPRGHGNLSQRRKVSSRRWKQPPLP